jgi:shikimate kinase
VPIVYLVGFMGAGKSAVGRRLAGLLRRPFHDLDQGIEQREGKSVAQIFREHGEAHFRALESQELERLSTFEDAVIAVGGGTYCRLDNHDLMERTGITIWLDASIDILYARCCRLPESRPLLAPKEEMARLRELRRPFYSRARFHFETGDAPVDELARRIQDALQGMEGENRDGNRQSGQHKSRHE